MPTHPVFLCLEGRPCIVLGGDGVAEGRARALASAGARVTVVAPELTAGLARLVRSGAVEHVQRRGRPDDLRGAFLAYASGCEPVLAEALRAEAEAAHVLLNVADLPEASSFHVPAVVDRGGLKIAIGTGGASPGLAAALRRDLEARFGPEYAPFVAILGAVRARLCGSPARAGALAALLDSPLLDLVRRGARAEIDRLLAAVAGADCSLATLGVDLVEAA